MKTLASLEVLFGNLFLLDSGNTTDSNSDTAQLAAHLTSAVAFDFVVHSTSSILEVKFVLRTEF